ncbi:MAG: PAS domain-containing protein [Chloroflexi bacterium]|nr:PAS domain-containing protein [Chloroflexota bacterium]
MDGWIVAGIAALTTGIVAWLLIQTQARLRSLEQQSTYSQKELRAQVEAATRLRQGLLKAVDDVLLVLDPDQRILYANPAAEALLGQSPIGETLMGTMRHPELEALIQDAQTIRGEGVERRIEFERHIFHARAVVFENNHKPAFEVLTLRDVTELQRLERSRREMVTNISHEFSSPVTSLSLMVDNLVDIVLQEKPKRVRKMARDIRNQVEILTQLVQEMRDLSLIESGQMPIRLTPTDLLTTINTSIDPLRPLAEDKEQTIMINVPAAVSVWADDQKIQRAIKNIAHNAVKFTPAGGTIHIAVTTNDDEATIAVSDNGVGISPEDLPRIFERFYQVDRARQSGTGLGLAIVRHIVLAHGGRTWAESEQGQGATFYITLALADA